ncbi:MAG TPA: peptidoglycan-binding domain-containing protein [Steroidobacteraceae bacterium]|nr:peptidoglycan-binding protein [Steroidobacteraceae bacterium]HQW09703.1 peptidoglycan-binding domain-containing protein [Steroidobacteraceae bacterium]HQX77090.1 peptidoglycan-binding domain-containing protein [Steroidobacteraceae bacterium]HQZ80970.1 peptidoglycan-binding domain-containing protein [Steroidobacteraceae bacterium]
MFTHRIVMALLIAFTFPAVAQQRVWTAQEKLICMTQERLVELGWSEARATGRMDDATRDALARYQKFAGLEATGEVSERVLGWLVLPCQVRLQSDWYGTGATTSQPLYGCRNPKAVSPATNAPDPGNLRTPLARGPTCGRARCVPPKVTPAAMEGSGLRFDGLYADQSGGLTRFIRFYPDDTAASDIFVQTPYEVACKLTREAVTAAGAPPQPYRLEGDQIRFEITSKGKRRAMSGRVETGQLRLVYDDEAALFVTNTMIFIFHPDPQ